MTAKKKFKPAKKTAREVKILTEALSYSLETKGFAATHDSIVKPGDSSALSSHIANRFDSNSA